VRRECVEREVVKDCMVRRGLDDLDVEDFWTKVHEATKILAA
jgi:hypothetical protein